MIAPSSWRSLLAPGIATLVVFGILLTLGSWQLDRKRWKEGLLDAIATRSRGDAVPAPTEIAWPEWRASADEFRRVRLRGRFLPGVEFPIHGLAEVRRGQAVQGFYVFAPLRLGDGETIIVNRGFVPTELVDPALRSSGTPTGQVEVVGLARAPEARGAFVPPNDPDRKSWFVRDVGEMANSVGLGRVAPFYVDADATPNPGGWPRGGQTRTTLSNDHLSYALTWFGLAATLLGVFTAFAWRRLARDDGAGGPVAGDAMEYGPGR